MTKLLNGKKMNDIILVEYNKAGDNMGKNIMRFFPILLALCILVDIVGLFVTDISANAWITVKSISTIIDSISISLVVFYVAIKKDDMAFGKIGLAVLLLYVAIELISIIAFKTFDLNIKYIKVYSVVITIERIIGYVINCLRYWCILELISECASGSRTELIKIGAEITIAIFYLFSVIILLAEIDYTATFYKLNNIVYSLFELAVLTFIVYQVLDNEEKTVLAPTPVEQSSESNPFADNKPKFRNPALEEQEARIKAQQEAENMAASTPTQQSIPSNIPEQNTGVQTNPTVPDVNVNQSVTQDNQINQ